MTKTNPAVVVALALVSGCSVQSAQVAASTQYAGGGGPAPVAVERLAAPMPSQVPAPDRPGLGTTWGEAVADPISYTAFQRASAQPWAEMVLHYNDAQGVAAHADYLGAPVEPVRIDAGDGSLTVSIVDESGHLLPGYVAGDRTLVVGEDGARYRIVVRNQAPVRFEIVTSVDGLDVIDGKPADPARRGYIVEPYGVLAIDGFRTSDNDVAAFRFGSVAQSYAAQTAGDRDVGVIGMAIFSERGAMWSRNELQRRDTANPFPARGYAVPPPQ